MAKFIKSRTPAQCRSHHQKKFKKSDLDVIRVYGSSEVNSDAEDYRSTGSQSNKKIKIESEDTRGVKFTPFKISSNELHKTGQSKGSIFFDIPVMKKSAVEPVIHPFNPGPEFENDSIDQFFELEKIESPPCDEDCGFCECSKKYEKCHGNGKHERQGGVVNCVNLLVKMGSFLVKVVYKESDVGMLSKIQYMTQMYQMWTTQFGIKIE